MKRIDFFTIALACLALAVPASSELTPEQAKQTAALIADFGAKEFAVRQAAVLKLLAMGPDVAPLVKKTRAGTDDAEVKLRCQMVLRGLQKTGLPEPPKEEDEPSKVRLMGMKTTAEFIAQGGEATIAATLRNDGPRVALIEVRLQAPKEIEVLAPDVAQICFIEPGKELDVKWRVKGVAAGAAECSANFNLISSGRPVGATSRDIPADQKAALEKPWSGVWRSRDGYVYDGDMLLRVNPDGSVEGRIRWTLVEPPPGRDDLDERIGEEGVEYVWGLYDPKARLLTMEGYRRDDPKQAIGMDRYRLGLSPAGDKIGGVTWTRGAWAATFDLTPKAVQ